MKTLNHDEFDEGKAVEPVAPHNIVYGDKGWTDTLDDATLGALLVIGVVRPVKTVAGPGFETRVYVSVKGNVPDGTDR